jgi:hypothetical protein
MVACIGKRPGSSNKERGKRTSAPEYPPRDRRSDQREKAHRGWISGGFSLFADLVDFTKMSPSISAETGRSSCDLFCKFDELMLRKSKIKAIGDCYMAVSGLRHRTVVTPRSWQKSLWFGFSGSAERRTSQSGSILIGCCRVLGLQVHL